MRVFEIVLVGISTVMAILYAELLIFTLNSVGYFATMAGRREDVEGNQTAAGSLVVFYIFTGGLVMPCHKGCALFLRFFASSLDFKEVHVRTNL